MDELVRIRLLKVGDVVRVRPCAGAYTDLPPGLPDGSTVTVLKVRYGYADVADASGKVFTVAFPQIEMPRDIWWHGKWIDRVTNSEGERAYQWALRLRGEERS